MSVEHVNVTLADPDATAALLCRLFGYRIRWSGAALNGGYSVHVGDDDSYLALYRPPQSELSEHSTHTSNLGLNHVGLVVDDLRQVEGRVIAEGMQPHSHGDYEPGERFYFDLPCGLEIEVVSYR